MLCFSVFPLLYSLFHSAVSSELNLAESFSVLAFYMYGGMYNIFNGTEVENITVDFINEANGQIINSANSNDMGE